MSENSTITVTTQYFANMKAEAGMGEEKVTTSASTTLELFDELQARHGFTIGSAETKVVVNEEFCKWDKELADGDLIVFVPPIAGG